MNDYGIPRFLDSWAASYRRRWWHRLLPRSRRPGHPIQQVREGIRYMQKHYGNGQGSGFWVGHHWYDKP